MRELQLGDSFSRAAPKELGAAESFEFAPRMKSRAAAAITVVMTEQEGQAEATSNDRLLQRTRGLHFPSLHISARFLCN